MSWSGVTQAVKVADVIQRYGKCLELVPIDPDFHGITVGLYVKDATCTVWTFSRKPGAQDRIRAIRDRLAVLGGLAPVETAHNQVRFPCGHLHLRLLKFLLAQSVGRNPGYSTANQELAIKDTKTELTLKVSGTERDGRWVYEVSGEGQAPDIPLRLRMVVAGFVRYGEMEKVSDTEVIFPCGRRHDELIRVLLPYSRNVTAVESMMAEEALRGQMTTGTLGFTPR